MPLRLVKCFKLLVVGFYIILAIVLNGRQFAVVLQLIFELCELGDDPFSFFGEGVVIGGPGGAVHVVDALGEDHGPAGAGRCVGKGGWVPRVVLRWAVSVEAGESGDVDDWIFLVVRIA